MTAWIHHTVNIGGAELLYLDIGAFFWFLAAWFGYASYADSQYAKRLNLIRIMDDMRERWMRQMLRRDNRMVDAALIGNIQRSISFLASTAIIILIGILSVLRAKDQGVQAIGMIPFASPISPFMYEVKTTLLALMFVYAFFKLTWSLRQYNYTSILVGAAPMHNEQKSLHKEYADRLAKLSGNAARHFNMGLRAYYFGLALVSWFVSGQLFIAVTSLVIYVVYRREFRSHTVNNLIALDKETAD